MLGSDSLNSLTTWRERGNHPAMHLGGIPTGTLSVQLVRSLQVRCKIDHRPAPILEISSSLVRERVRLGKSIKCCPDAVREYILTTRVQRRKT